MNDYELYLVKRAHYKKQLMQKMAVRGVTVLGQPVMYDPYSVYKKRKQEVIDAIKAPEWTHDNARREAEAAVAAAKRNNLIAGATTGTALGLGGSYALDRYGGYAEDGRLSKRIPMYLANTGLGTVAGLSVGALTNRFGDFKQVKQRGWDKGDKLDREQFHAARKKYDEDVANAIKDFNIKYTGVADPDHDAIYRGGIKLHDEK